MTQTVRYRSLCRTASSPSWCTRHVDCQDDSARGVESMPAANTLSERGMAGRFEGRLENMADMEFGFERPAPNVRISFTSGFAQVV